MAAPKRISRRSALYIIGRSLWALCFVVAVAFCIFLVLQLIMLSRYQKLTTSISIVRPSKKDKFKFPDVIICPLDTDNYTRRIELGLRGDNETEALLYKNLYKMTSLQTYEDLRHFFQSADAKNIVDQVSFLFRKAGVKTIQDLLLYLAVDCKNYLTTCTREDQESPDVEYCCKHTVPMIEPDNGVCRMLPGEWLDLSRTTVDAYLIQQKVEAFTGKQWYSPYQETVGYRFIFSYIYEESDDEYNIEAAPGNTDMILKLTKTVRVSTITNPCNENSMVGKQKCVLKCQRAFIYKLCGCIPTGLVATLEGFSSICGPQNLKVCVLGNKAAQASLTKDMQECTRQCQEPCSKWELEASKEHEAKIEGDEEEGKVVVASWGFRELQWTEIYETSSLTCESILGGIKGLVGIWMGGTVMLIILLVWTVVNFWISAGKRRCIQKRWVTEEAVVESVPLKE